MSTAKQQLAIESEAGEPSAPIKFFEAMRAYQLTAALKAAIELDLFTTIGAGRGTILDIAEYVRASQRGVRILCDFLTITGFLVKTFKETEPHYVLTADSAMFLSKSSPAYVGVATAFLGSDFVTEQFRDLVAVVRAGGPVRKEPEIDRDLPMWTDFARSMAPIAYPVAERVEKLVRTSKPIKVLDIAAGHGMFGLLIAQNNPKAQIVALDWPSVLAVARENAERFGVADRYSLRPGDALKVALGGPYELVLATNLLHHWDPATIRLFLKKAHDSLASGGRVVVVEFAPNDDRVTPAPAAAFALTMLANTPAGDAYTVNEHFEMLTQAGFTQVSSHALLPTPQTAIIGVKR